MDNATQNLTSPIRLPNDMMIRAFTYNNSASATLNMSEAITIAKGATLLLDGMDNGSVQYTEVKFVNNTSGSAIIVEEGGTLRVGAATLSSGENNTSPFISSTGGKVIIQGNPTFTYYKHGTVETLPYEDDYSSAANNQSKTSAETATALIEAKGNTEVEIKGGDITATGGESLVKFEGEGNSVTLSGGNISGTQGPALAIPQGVTLAIPEGSTAKVTSQAADKQAIDLEAGANVKKGAMEITVENGEGDNYVDNYGNIILILAAGATADSEKLNAAVILPDGTIIQGSGEKAPTITTDENGTTTVAIPAGGSVQKPDGPKQESINGGSATNNGAGTVVEEAKIPATSISLDKTSVTLYSNTTPNTVTLAAAVTPADSTDTVVWESSDPSVAAVENGVVTAVGNGTATITAKAGSASAACTVSVTAYAPVHSPAARDSHHSGEARGPHAHPRS